MNNRIYYKRKGKIYIEKGKNKLPEKYVYAFVKNIEPFGLTISKELALELLTLTEEKLAHLHNDFIEYLKDIFGARVKYEPMYPNFPDQVREMPMSELYINAIYHYLGAAEGKMFLPVYEKQERGPLLDKVELFEIKLGTKEEFYNILPSILKAKSAISTDDKKDVEFLIKNYGDVVKKYLPEEIPQKETAAFVMSKLMLHTTIAEEVADKYIRTATDVLRVATALSDGDVSLAMNTKFKNIPQKYRRILLKWLERCDNLAEDMSRYKGNWKRLGEKLHPGSYKNKYPKTFEAFDIIRNNKPFETFNKNIEKYLLNKDYEKLTSLLAKRPGEYARRLDLLLRKFDNTNETLETLKRITPNVASKVLLQMYAHFKSRPAHTDLRVFFPKGELARLMAIENNLPEMNKELSQKVLVIIENTLKERFSKLPALGKIYIDEELKNYPVPLSQRSASKALKTIPRGSKLKLTTENTIRLFIWWKDGSSRTDIDLSIVLLDKDYKFNCVVAYYNLKEFGAYHSGDIVAAPNGASEFIDIDINKFIHLKGRFVIMSINSFSGQAYSDLPECFAGFMYRDFPGSGEIYDPKTVVNKFDLTGATKIAMPLIVDLEERRVIWTDMSLTKNPPTNNNVHNNLSSLSILAKAMVEINLPSLYDLFTMHAQVRGQIVNLKEEADTIFSTTQGVTPFDIPKILSEFL